MAESFRAGFIEVRFVMQNAVQRLPALEADVHAALRAYGSNLSSAIVAAIVTLHIVSPAQSCRNGKAWNLRFSNFTKTFPVSSLIADKLGYGRKDLCSRFKLALRSFSEFTASSDSISASWC